MAEVRAQTETLHKDIRSEAGQPAEGEERARRRCHTHDESLQPPAVIDRHQRRTRASTRPRPRCPPWRSRVIKKTASGWRWEQLAEFEAELLASSWARRVRGPSFPGPSLISGAMKASRPKFSPFPAHHLLRFLVGSTNRARAPPPPRRSKETEERLSRSIEPKAPPQLHRRRRSAPLHDRGDIHPRFLGNPRARPPRAQFHFP
jgi:hypothetical protein